MAQYTATQRAAGTASSTNLNNFGLTIVTVGNLGKVKLISWGGGDTSLISYSSRWARPNNTPATPTSIMTPVITSGGGAAAVATFNTYSTAPASATQPAGNLFAQDWNSQGGGGVVVLPIGGEWFFPGAALASASFCMIACGNVTGASANTSFGIQWEE